ncbi:MAG: hypothetical protein IKD07_05595, partial [Clostridia bacterium]|nr:hypothetical protein [Clostridia bacterium]
LVSVCVLLLLAFPLFTGVQAASIHEFQNSVSLTLASARSIPCTTYAGAFDAYGKAVLYRNGYYRAMCAPEALQKELETEMLENGLSGQYPDWDSGLEEWANSQKGYYIYNLKQIDRNTYEGLFVVELNYPPNGKAEALNTAYLAVQNLRAEKENGRWVIITLEAFRHVETPDRNLLYGCIGLPGITYTGKADNFQIVTMYQTVHTVESAEPNTAESQFFSNSDNGKAPIPNAKFTFAARGHSAKAVYLGMEEDKDTITKFGLSLSPVYEGEKRPSKLKEPPVENGGGGSNSGEQWFSKTLNAGWNPVISIDSGGGSTDPEQKVEHPQYYAADLYINGKKTATVDLYPKEGGIILE